MSEEQLALHISDIISDDHNVQTHCARVAQLASNVDGTDELSEGSTQYELYWAIHHAEQVRLTLLAIQGWYQPRRADVTSLPRDRR
jgi:hypothetical protein